MAATGPAGNRNASQCGAEPRRTLEVLRQARAGLAVSNANQATLSYWLSILRAQLISISARQLENERWLCHSSIVRAGCEMLSFERSSEPGYLSSQLYCQAMFQAIQDCCPSTSAGRRPQTNSHLVDLHLLLGSCSSPLEWPQHWLREILCVSAQASSARARTSPA